MSSVSKFSRRDLLKGLGAGLGLGLGGASVAPLVRRARASEAAAELAGERRLLFVIGATGGASLIDSFLPVASTEVPSSVDPQTLDVYEPAEIAEPPGSEIRCVRPVADTGVLTPPAYSIEQFLADHYQELTVVAHDLSSVNHAVAQKRSLTGAGIDSGRTIAEAVAARHGAGLPLANCNMGTEGFTSPGDDRELPAFARAEFIGDPLSFATATHGVQGLAGAPPLAAVARARSLRERLEGASPFGQTFRNVPLRQRYLETRAGLSAQLEASGAIEKLLLLPADGEASALGLDSSPLLEDLRATFPGLDRDRWQQRGALAFLLSYYGLTAASTISLALSPSFTDEALTGAPLAFDFAHTTHRATQSVMWSRVLQLVDGLIGLLQRFDYMGDPALGKMWDRSLIYIATDFGRDKVRPANNPSYGTGHHLNNGSVLLSPLLIGNRVFGGVDPGTLLTHGFDRRSGAPRPDVTLREGDIYSLIAQALDVDFPERRDMSAVIRS